MNYSLRGYYYRISKWDQVNNSPLFRKGIAATHQNLDYNGKSEFLIGAACFPGSSGPTVFIINENSYSDINGNIYFGRKRVMLLGVLYAGPQHTATGEIRIINVPTSQKPIIMSTIPNNLNLVIKTS